MVEEKNLTIDSGLAAFERLRDQKLAEGDPAYAQLFQAVIDATKKYVDDRNREEDMQS